ncbi:MAG: hypothetical protein JST17_15445 [Bacteroidetes bacterium]|nr:hypothetical protein [Bacteroidota bacterium]MBS1930579.1 hypothetical protein [Bacteroidota bacterium]
MKNIIYTYLIVTLAACNSNRHTSQNLIINGSAEEPRYDTTPKGVAKRNRPLDIIGG